MLPHYYSSLGPFAETFRQGVPMLTYHKLGPRPANARLKGLYVSTTLFRRQMQELKEAGFHFASLDQFKNGLRQDHSATSLRNGSANGNRMATVSPSLVRQQPTVLVTFDDGFRSVRQYGLDTMAGLGVQAIQFLLPDLLGKTNTWEQHEGEAPAPLMDAMEVREWLAAGHQIGSHSCTHPWLTRIPPGEAKEEISASRKKLEDTFQVPVRHFCYPYGDWNRPVRDLVAEAGYLTACTTNAGVNQPDEDRFALKRFTARYPSRNLKNLWRWLTG